MRGLLARVRARRERCPDYPPEIVDIPAQCVVAKFLTDNGPEVQRISRVQGPGGSLLVMRRTRDGGVKVKGNQGGRAILALLLEADSCPHNGE